LGGLEVRLDDDRDRQREGPAILGQVQLELADRPAFADGRGDRLHPALPDAEPLRRPVRGYASNEPSPTIRARLRIIDTQIQRDFVAPRAGLVDDRLELGKPHSARLSAPAR
jgi:hypothetical protein